MPFSLLKLTAQVFGPIATPPVQGFRNVDATGGGGLVLLISRIVQVLIVFGGVYVLFTILMAGYKYISAGGNASQVSEAWGMIWQSFIGLLILTSAILIVSIFSWIVTGNPGTFLQLRIPTPIAPTT